MNDWLKALSIGILVSVLLLASPAKGLDPSRTINQFGHTAWTFRDGVPSNIRALAQTPDGFLWLGTAGGLYRFDGVSAEKVDQLGGKPLPSVSILALLATRSGDLWISYADVTTKLARISHGKLTTFSLADKGLLAGHAEMMTEDTQGGVWVVINHDSTPPDVIRFNGQSWRRISGDFGVMNLNPLRGVWAIGPARDGAVWVKNGNSLQYWRPGSSRFVAAPGYSGRVVAFAEGRDGRLWTADSNARRFYVVPDIRGVPDDKLPLPTLGATVPQSFRGTIILDRDGTIWCANRNFGGLARLHIPTKGGKPVVDRFTSADGLTSDNNHAILEDREGNIWVGTDQGLDRFRAADIVADSRFTLAIQFPDAFSIGDNTYLYTGWNPGDQSHSSRISGASDVPGARDARIIYRVYRDQAPTVVARNVLLQSVFGSPGWNGSIVYSDMDGKVFLLRGERVERLVLPQKARDVAADPFGGLWYYVLNEGYFRYRDGHATPIVVRRDHPVAEAQLTFQWRGHFWLLYADGALFEYDGKTFRSYPQAGKLDLGQVYAAAPTDRDVFMGGQLGLGRFDGAHFQSVGMSRVAAFGAVNSLATTPADLWIQSHAGLMRASLKDVRAAFDDARAPLPYRLFDYRDGLPALNNLEQPGTMHYSSDGRLWFVTAAGPAWVEPDRLAKNSVPPPVVIRSITVGNTRYWSPADLRLPSGTSKLQIDYVALSLTAPDRNRYRYKLDGVDDNWVDPGQRRQAFYTNLRPGNYTFHVIAANNDGVWNKEGATLAFSIPPTFVQSWTFYILLALIAALLLWVAYSWRMKRIAAQLQARLTARLAERERIARELHDTLLQGVQGLVLRFQSVADRLPKDQPEKPMLESALDRAESLLVEGRDRVRELRTAETSGELADMLTATAEEFADSDARFRMTVEGAPRPLHPLVADEASRIGEEAIRNAFLHSAAKSIDVAIVYTRRDLTLIINDNGQGLDEKTAAKGEKSGHYGLTGMRERAQRIGGELTISSGAGAGCQVILKIPGGSAYPADRGAVRSRLPIFDWAGAR